MPHFILKVMFEGSDKMITNLSPNSTISDLKVQINLQFSKLNNKTYYVKKLNGDEMTNDNQKLSAYGYNYTPGPFAKSVQIIYDASGGSFPKEVEVKKAKCIIFDEIDDCIYMECNHYISHEGICGHIKGTKEKDFCSKIKCPIVKCKKVWDYEECLYYANFDKKTHDEYLKIFKQRYMNVDFSQCPNLNCKALNKRDRKKVKIYRLVCGSCGLHFCDFCKQKWIKSGLVLCGNKQCETYEIQQALNTCKMLPKNKNDWTKEYPDKSIPAVRACPKCWAIINHKEGCLRMPCPHCGHQFCYACLQPWKGHGYKNKICYGKTPAARQQLN